MVSSVDSQSEQLLEVSSIVPIYWIRACYCSF